MDPWIGPAIVAAVVSGIVSAVGWFVTSWQTASLERRQRKEKVRDFQIALRAEIRTDYLNLHSAERSQFLAQVTESYRADKGYRPFIPRLASIVVFAVIIEEIQVLPEDVIRPVIRYSSLRQTIDHFIDDLRSESVGKLAVERQLLMYRDYLVQLDQLEVFAARAINALDQSLNSSGEDPSTRLEDEAGDEASAGPQNSP